MGLLLVLEPHALRVAPLGALGVGLLQVLQPRLLARRLGRRKPRLDFFGLFLEAGLF
jgi:hypothetical protein